MNNLILDIETSGLNSALDRIILIGCKLNDNETKIIYNQSEKDTLIELGNYLDSIGEFNLIGFANDFDVGFIRVRSILNEIRPIKFNKVMDLRDILLDGEKKIFGRLNEFGSFLGIPQEIDGSIVPILWKSNKIDSIKNHCIADIKTTKILFDRLNKLELIKEE